MTEIKHGTTTGYRNGCRCDECRISTRAGKREWRSRQTPGDAKSHGSYSTYLSYKCRCDECRDAAREYAFKNRYGIGVTEIRGILEGQGGLCPLCRKDIRDLHVVDHDRSTGRVRGVLCPSCNQALGKFQDDPGIIRAAINYLR